MSVSTGLSGRKARITVQVALVVALAIPTTASAGAMFDACRQHYFQRFEQDLIKRIDREKSRRCSLKGSNVNDRLKSLRCEILIDSYKPSRSSPLYLGQSKYEMALRYADSKCQAYKGF